MSVIDTIISRVETLGYKYEREYFDVKQLPVTIRHRTCYINMVDISENTVDFQLRSTSPIKCTRTGFSINLVDERRNINLGAYTTETKNALVSLINNSGTNKIAGVSLIEITRNTYVETGEYIVFTVEIQYQEFL
jgi:hypothetical protein